MGLRSGAQGGPIALEAADVAYVMLAPVDRRRALLRPTFQRVRSAAFAVGVVGAVAGQLAGRRLPGTPFAWFFGGALFGATVGLLWAGGALVAHVVRVRLPAATLLSPGAPHLADRRGRPRRVGPRRPRRQPRDVGLAPAPRRPARHRCRARARHRRDARRRAHVPRRAGPQEQPRGAAPLRGDDAGPAHGRPAASAAQLRADPGSPVDPDRARRACARRVAARVAQPAPDARRSAGADGRARRRRRRLPGRRVPGDHAGGARHDGAARSCSAWRCSSRCRRRSTSPTAPSRSPSNGAC